MNSYSLCILLMSSVYLFSYNTLQFNTIISAVKAGTSINASRCDLRGIGSLLRGLNFSKANFSGALFNVIHHDDAPTIGTIKVAGQISDLTGANFTGALLVSTGFSGALLQGVNFAGADVCYADFTNANLKGAINLDKAKNISLARFCGATMPDGTKFTGATWQSPAGVTYYSHCSSQQTTN